jgi:hypothetical protein
MSSEKIHQEVRTELKAKIAPALVVVAFLLPLAGVSQAAATSKPIRHTLVGEQKTAGNLRIKVDAVRWPVVAPTHYRAFNPKDQPRGRIPIAHNEEFLAIEFTVTDVGRVPWDGDGNGSWVLGPTRHPFWAVFRNHSFVGCVASGCGVSGEGAYWVSPESDWL